MLQAWGKKTKNKMKQFLNFGKFSPVSPGTMCLVLKKTKEKDLKWENKT